jgi:hypothetical protein
MTNKKLPTYMDSPLLYRFEKVNVLSRRRLVFPLLFSWCVVYYAMGGAASLTLKLRGKAFIFHHKY